MLKEWKGRYMPVNSFGMLTGLSTVFAPPPQVASGDYIK
jgi:hypothetical protein